MRPLLPVLALLLAALAGCSGDDGHSPGEKTVEIKGKAFSPGSVVLQQGDRVLFQNRDAVAHSVAMDNGERSTGRIAPGQEAGFALPTTGSHAYHCAIHPEMKGTLVVLAA